MKRKFGQESQSKIIAGRLAEQERLVKIGSVSKKFREPVVPRDAVLAEYLTDEDFSSLTNDVALVCLFIDTQQYPFQEFVLNNQFLDNPSTKAMLKQYLKLDLVKKYGKENVDRWLPEAWLYGARQHKWNVLNKIPEIRDGFVAFDLPTFIQFLQRNTHLASVQKLIAEKGFQRYREAKLKDHQIREEYARRAMQAACFHFQCKLPISMAFVITDVKSSAIICNETEYRLDPKFEHAFRFTMQNFTQVDHVPTVSIDFNARETIEILTIVFGRFYDFMRGILIAAGYCDYKCSPNVLRTKEYVDRERVQGFGEQAFLRNTRNRI